MNQSTKTKYILPRFAWIDYALVFWLLFLIYINFIEPSSVISYVFFFLSGGLALFTTLLAIKYRLKFDLLLTLLILSFLILYFFSLLSPLNSILATALFTALYFLF